MKLNVKNINNFYFGKTCTNCMKGTIPNFIQISSHGSKENSSDKVLKSAFTVRRHNIQTSNLILIPKSLIDYSRLFKKDNCKMNFFENLFSSRSHSQSIQNFQTNFKNCLNDFRKSTFPIQSSRNIKINNQPQKRNYLINKLNKYKFNNTERNKGIKLNLNQKIKNNLSNYPKSFEDIKSSILSEFICEK